MAYFKAEWNRWVNISNADEIRVYEEGRGRYSLRVKRGGVTTVVEGLLDLPEIDRLCSPIVPASAGQEAVVVYADDEAGDNGRPTSAWVSRHTVVAWRVMDWGGDRPVAEPILTTPTSSNGYLMWFVPGGRLECLQLEEEFDDLEKAKERVLLLEQDAWDQKNARTQT